MFYLENFGGGSMFEMNNLPDRWEATACAWDQGSVKAPVLIVYASTIALFWNHLETCSWKRCRCLLVVKRFAPC